MKIYHIITGFNVGGAEKMLLDIVRRQVEDGCDVTVFYLKEVNHLRDHFQNLCSIEKVEFSLRGMLAFRKIMKEHPPTIFHTHLGHADLFGIFSTMGLKINGVTTFHNIWYKNDFRDYFIFLLYRLGYLFHRRWRAIGISRSVLSHIKRWYGLRPPRSKLLYNFVSEYKGDCAPEQNAAEFAVGFVGRLEPQKSVETLISALAKLTEKDVSFSCTIVGDGSLKDKLEKLCQEFEIESSVNFCGFVSEPRDYIRNWDVMVLPSSFEGFGIVLLEAFQLGIPCIATEIEGPKEIIEESGGGLLFQCGDVDGLTEKLMFARNNPVGLQEMGNRGKNFCAERFGFERYYRGLMDFYEE
ncbi:glycosyltransferase family 4 protein [bacterium]|nr:glycosyltransferase family 4 protein [bacterium]